MGNTGKSWKGAPTTNLFSSPLDMSDVSWAINSVVVVGDKIELISATTASHYIFSDSSLITGTQYTQSVLAKAGELTILQIAPSTGFGGVGGFINYDLINGVMNITGTGIGTITYMGDGWYHCTYTETSTSTGSGMMVFCLAQNINSTRLGSFSGAAGEGLYLKQPQIEANEFATPFVVGSRSTTNNLIDITGNHSLTSSNMQYNEDNTFEFTGVNSLVVCGIGNDFFPLPEFAMEFWFRCDGTTPTTGTDNGLCGFTYGIATKVSPTYITFYLDDGIAFTSVSSPSIYNFHDSSWHHLVVQANSTMKYMYVDGVFVNSSPGSWSGSTRWPTSGCYIGQDINNSSFHFRGSIPITKLYNRMLTVDEVKRGFESTRGRFGI
jgi:hypothetical protein